jgi:hypothetical protein
MAAAATVLAGIVLIGCSGELRTDTSSSSFGNNGAPLGHVHGLGINPADDTLFVATHLGVYRVANGVAERTADRTQDTMAFIVVGSHTTSSPPVTPT